MPKKLVVLVVLLGIEILLSFAWPTLSSVAGGITAIVLLVGLLKGGEGARELLRFIALVALVVGVVGLVRSFASDGGRYMSASEVGATVVLIVHGMAIAKALFYIWCLGQADVKKWMFRKNLGLDRFQDAESI